jgi:uncharacterized protein (TIGR03118 family)
MSSQLNSHPFVKAKSMTPVAKSLTLALSCAVLALPLSARAAEDHGDSSNWMPPLATNTYAITPLTTNGSGGMFSDTHLVNPWGLSRSSGSPWWVSDNGTGLATLYTGTGSVIPLVVTIPAAKQGSMGSPTGTIYNGSMGFTVGAGDPAVFLFATEDGTISGWNPKVNATNAVIAVNESKQKASFKGLTTATADMGHGTQTLLYAADFTLGRVEVFDSSFRHVRWIEDAFRDNDDSDDYSPFNVQNLGGNIFVAYAKPGSGNNQQNGTGLGRVKIFSPDGHMLMKLEDGSWFNAPWGMAIASSDFGPYSHSILVGNFGSGWIAAFNPVTGQFQDFLRDTMGQIVSIPGIWAISPGNDGKAGNATSLYYSAGGANETSGTLGTLTATQNPQGNAQ